MDIAQRSQRENEGQGTRQLYRADIIEICPGQWGQQPGQTEQDQARGDIEPKGGMRRNRVVTFIDQRRPDPHIAQHV